MVKDEQRKYEIQYALILSHSCICFDIIISKTERRVIHMDLSLAQTIMDGQAKLIDSLKESLAARDQLIDLKDQLIEKLQKDNDSFEKELQSIRAEVLKMQNELTEIKSLSENNEE